MVPKAVVFWRLIEVCISMDSTHFIITSAVRVVLSIRIGSPLRYKNKVGHSVISNFSKYDLALEPLNLENLKLEPLSYKCLAAFSYSEILKNIINNKLK